MIPLLHRYVLKEVLVAIGLAMGLFIFILLLGNLLKDVASLVAAGKLGIWVFLKLVALLIPYIASYALPLGVLTGSLMALGRLSSQQEITAMKSAGQSLYQIASPVFLIAFIGMIGGVLINLQYAPKSRIAYKQMMISAVSKNPAEFIEERRFIHEFPNFVIYMGDKDGSLMKDFWIWELDEKQRVKLFLRAKEGELNYDRKNNSLVLVLRDATAEKRDDDDPETFTGDALRSIFFGELPLELPMDKLFGEKNQKRAKIKELTFAQLMKKRKAEMNEEAEKSEGMSQLRMKMQIHIQKNFAMAFSVFSLSIFGVPLAIRVGRKESYANLAMALVIALTYYFLIIVVSWFEGNISLRPDLLIWTPNILFQVFGFIMIRNAGRH